jgi:hypothetical protein
MRTDKFVFEGKAISFSIDRENNMMINATEMAKIFGAQVNEFISNDNTKKFVTVLCQNGNSRFENEFMSDGKFVKVIIGGRNPGTWMDRRVALKFAAWLDPFFEVWVYSTIEELLFGRHLRREQSFERTLELQKEKEDLALKPNKTGDDFNRYLDIQRELKKEVALRKSWTNENITQLKLSFDDEIFGSTTKSCNMKTTED